MRIFVAAYWGSYLAILIWAFRRASTPSEQEVEALMAARLLKIRKAMEAGT